MRIEPIEIFSHCIINNYSSRTPLLLARKFSKDFHHNPHNGLLFQLFYYSNLIDCFKFSFIEQYSRLLFIFLYKMVSYYTIVTDRSFNPVKDLWLGKHNSTNYLIFLKHSLLFHDTHNKYTFVYGGGGDNYFIYTHLFTNI